MDIPHRFRCAGFAASLLLAGPLPAFAQSPSAPTAAQLQAELDRRDAIIADLLQRVQALERRLGASPVAGPAPAADARAPSRAATIDQADEALLERALERSLVLSGGALLPSGVRQVEPSLSYDHARGDGLALLGNTVVSRSFRRENIGAALALRVGLPWSSQFDLSLPYAHQRIEALVDGVPFTTSASGMGDIQATLTHQFLNEHTSRIALLGGVGWIHSGRASSLRPLVLGLPDFAAPASIGSGHDAFVARLTASKRIDPLVFVGSLSHTWNRPETVEGMNVRVGAVDGASVRAILAASPDVSLRAGFSLSRGGKTRLNGVSLDGTRSVASLIELGASIVIDRSRLLDVAIGVGVTDESPDFLFNISMPIRF